ncbi:LLM class flavin-dependent oxidoreductase [Nonomuraea typhae]|uniref:LLM class flavin-dependent oxidoreductase n=1 Tax=Nonomuraea typhae TaxID=2603600 RepID=A0ABW7YVZ6_9ACTN
MKFAITYSTAAGLDPDALVAYARHAEECGFEGLYLPEHVVLYPGAALGGFAFPPALRLLTVGLGTLPGEAEAAGVDFGTRGRRADEAIDVLRLLWEGGEEGVSFDGEFFAFDDACVFPKPHGVTHLPIHVGGSSTAAARRAGRRGDGYFPGGALTPAERAAQWELARATAAEAGRGPLEYTRWGSMIDMDADRVEAFAAQGVTRIVVAPAAPEPERQREEMSAFAERFIF